MRPALVLLLTCASCGGATGPFSPLPVDPEAIRRACAMEVSCFPTPPITPGGSCVSQFELGLATGAGIFFGPSATDLQRYIGCANSASNCSDALNCASRDHGIDWCKAHPKPTCEGDLLISCIGGWGLLHTDCSTNGLHCDTANGASACTNGSSCDPSVPARCDGNRYIKCDFSSKLESSIDCGSLFNGGTCMSTTMGTSSTTGCVPPASGSCVTGSATCDGATAVLCPYGAELRVACGQFASHCVIDSNNKFACVPDANNCSSSAPDTCSGNSLQMCVNGTLAQTPCTSIGLTTCQTSATGARCN